MRVGLTYIHLCLERYKLRCTPPFLKSLTLHACSISLIILPNLILHGFINSLPPPLLVQMFHCGCDPLNNFYSLTYCVHIYSSSPPLTAPPQSPAKPHGRPNRRPKRAYIPLFPRPPATPYHRLQQPQCALSLLDPATKPASEPPTSPLPPLPRPPTRRSRHRHLPHH